MRIEVLKGFIALADSGSMTAAAKLLHISQPTLSRQISGLEEEFGAQLYRRSDGVIKLTAEGRTLYRYATSIVEMAERARTEVADSQQLISGSVYIGHGHPGSLAVLGEAVRLTHETHPHIRFHFTSGDTPSMIDQINQGSIDFFLECDVKERPRFNMLRIPHLDEWCLVVPDESPLAVLHGGGGIKPQELEGQPVVMSRQVLESRTIRRWADSSFAKMDVTATFTLGDVDLLTQAQLGAIFAYRARAANIDGYRCLTLDPPLFEHHGFVWRKDRELSHAARAFLTQLELVCSTQGD